MEALMIINSTLVAVTLYFIKDAHGGFKDLVKRVERLESKVKDLSGAIKDQTKHLQND
ncbi:MAG: hypothetical protein HYZ43_06880 [Flavobacteriia bacterium]|jgi:hypothetical protein|nr:hypothetical protein [Flavobacteriia bacterium]